MMTKKLFSIATLLLVSVSAYAADVYPMYFESLKQAGGDSAAQQEYWEDLMKYKLWGTTGITFNKEVLHIADESGYNGTASGNITFGNGRHHLGGPILAGGSIGIGISNGNINTPGNMVANDTLAGGPLRALGDFVMPDWAANEGPIQNSFYEGPYCIQGAVKTNSAFQYDKSLVNWPNQISGGLYSHKWVELSAAEAESADSTSYTYERIWNAGDYSETDSINEGGDHYRKVAHYFAKSALGVGTYEQCPSDVPFVDTHLEVPVWPEPDSWKPGVSLDQYNKVGYINIPPETPSDSGTYDLYIDNLKMCCTAETQLYVVMPPGGRLTRIFVRDGFNITNDAGKAKIQVVYAEDESKYNSESGEWDLEGATYITNKAYAGNLMFYTKQDVSWASMTDPSFQGTFMTTGTFRIADHFTLAGQLVASKLWFESKIVGDFRYVPFDPPILAIDPELLEKGAFPENDLDVEIPISLDEKTNTDVSFNYCFDLDKSTASVKDFNKTDMAPFPVCELRDTTWTYTFDEDGETKLDSTVQSVVVTKDSGYVVIKSGKLSPSADMKAYLNVYYDGVEEDDEILNMVIFNLTGAVLEGNKREGSFNLNIIDAVDPPKTEPITLVGAEDLFYTFSKTDFPYTHKRDLEMGGVVIATLPNKGALYYFGQPIKSANTIIPADSIDQLQYKGAKDGYGVPYVTFQFQVMDEVKVRSATTLATIDLAPVNDAPTITATEFTIDENSEVDAVVTGSFTTKDVDDSIFVYSLVDGDTAIFKIDPATGVVSVKKAELDFETKSTYELTVQVRDAAETTAGVGKDSATVTITITLNDVNEVPVLADASADVDENVPAGTEVTTVVATDVDAEDAGKLQYEFVGGNTGDAFAIDKTTGLVTVKGKLNHETIPVYTITVKVTDSKKNSTTAILTITVNDINEKPVIADKTPTFEVDENALGGVEVGSISVYDDDGDVLSYSIEAVDADGADTIFVIDADGKITVKADSTIDYEKNQAYEIRVIVSDGKTPELKDTAIVTINVGDVNEKPEIADANFTPEENAANGSVVGAVVASDPDIKNPKFSTLTYTIIESNSPFKMDGNVIKVADKSKLDYETNPTFVVHVRVTDGSLADTATVTISLKDMPEPPKFTDKTPTFAVDENSPAKTLVGTVSATDVDDGETLIYSLVDPSDKFVVDPATGKITVKADNTLDYETKATYSVSVIVTDKDGLKDTAKVTIKINDVNENPVVAEQTFNLYEHKAVGSVVGTVAASDLDTAKAFTQHVFSSVGGDEDMFKIDANGQITSLKEFDYETEEKTYTLVVKVADKADPTLFVTETMTINIKNVNENPVVATEELKVDENSKNGTVVGTIEATDPDGDDLTYELVGSSAAFTVTPEGSVVVKDGSKLDFESKSSETITVKVSDPNGGSATKEITVKINDVNEAPVIDPQTIVVPENAKPNTPVGQVFATDPDKKPEYSTLTYELVGKSDVFDVTPEGRVILKDTLDYETIPVYTIKVSVTDGTYSDTATVTIQVSNVKESSNITITSIDSDDTRWPIKNDTAYINRDFADISYKLKDKNGNVSYKDSSLTNLSDGCKAYVFTDKDNTLDNPGKDTLIVCVSTKIPEVAVSVIPHTDGDPSGVTITEPGEDQDVTYVNTSKNDVIVVTKDPVTGKKDSVKVTVKLDSVKVPSQTISAVEDVKKNFVPNAKPDSVTRTPEKGQIAVSYTQKVNGKTVVVTRYETEDGKPVLDKDGNEVVYVKYNTVVDGKNVTISYVADAETGAPIKQYSTSGSSNGAGSGNSGSSASSDNEEEIAYTISYEYKDAAGNIVNISYAADEKGKIVKNEEGDLAYEVSYTYTNIYGNSATSSTKITLDTKLPVVKILSPEHLSKLSAVSVSVVWTVDGVVQDTLNLQSLENGNNYIIRTYRDKAGNEASDTVIVGVKKPKNVVVELATPVTKMDEKLVAAVEEYYAENPSAKGSLYAVSVLNPKTHKAVEILNGTGSSSKPNKSGYEKDADKNIGPTLEIDLKMPSVNEVGGLATIDDIILSNGKISLDSANAGWKSKKLVTVDEYLDEHCSEDFKQKVDRNNLKGTPLYKVKYKMHVWVYSNLGAFLDEFSFSLDLNNDVQVDDAGMLTMFFNLNPGEEGALKDSKGRLYGTGAYLFKTEIKSTAVLQCDLPGIIYDTPGTKRGNKLVDTDESLTPFGYKHPNIKH